MLQAADLTQFRTGMLALAPTAAGIAVSAVRRVRVVLPCAGIWIIEGLCFSICQCCDFSMRFKKDINEGRRFILPQKGCN